MKTETEIYKILNRNTPKAILKEGLGSIGGSAVSSYQIHEIQLHSGCMYVSLLCNKKEFDLLKKEKEIKVESTGYWNTLSDDNVKVYTSKNILLHPIAIF